MSDDDRPWLGLYAAGVDPDATPAHATIPQAWAARVVSGPDRTAVRYFDGSLTARQLDDLSDALATGLATRHGVRYGDRVGAYLQNTSHYPVVMLALWKLGAIAVPLNPMYRGAELRRLVDDSACVGIVVSDRVVDEVTRTLAAGSVRFVLGSSDRAHQTRDDERVFGQLPPHQPCPDGTVDELIDEYAGQSPEVPELTGSDVAFITYTSGTTGPPKGALNSHTNFLHSVANYTRWVDLAPGDVVLAIAPMFHITGMVLNAGLSLLSDTTLVLTHRFNAAVVVEAIREHGVTFTIGSITAFNAFIGLPDAGPADFASIKTLYSGGAPIPPATITRFRERFGPYLHNVWGMTETTAAGIAVPRGREAPVHAASGTLSIGVPMQNVHARVIAPDGSALAPGEEGELEFWAPQVVSGYWQNSAATDATFPGGRLRTGDVAVMDDDGWIYLVDRLKDLINTSGFKVWPREVEDVLYEHPAVFEAAVVGEPDDYRGETVVAYVSLKQGAGATADELIAFGRERLAAYKRPRRVYLVDDLPKTATGKIRRRELRTDPRPRD
jgi:long-chain acyl-CoA synthetase